MKKVLVAMPNIGGIPPKTVASLYQLLKAMKLPAVAFIESSLVYDARNSAIEQAVNEGFEEILFIDSDLIFPDDAYEKLEALDSDIATGVYYKRAGDHSPVVYREVKPSTDTESAEAKFFETIPEGTFSVEGCGMGMCLIQIEAIKKIYNNGCKLPFEPFDGLGEDLAFCYRARQIGLTIKANSYIPLGHIGTAIYTKENYKGECK